jgi:hypothetical protein
MFAVEEAANADGSVQLKLTNASESPINVRAIPAQLAPKDAAPVEARLEAVKVGGKAAKLPVELKRDEVLTARVVPTATQAPPVLQRGATGKAVELLSSCRPRSPRPGTRSTSTATSAPRPRPRSGPSRPRRACRSRGSPTRRPTPR